MLKENLVYNKAFKFSVKMIEIYKNLVKTKKEYVLSKQVLRSSTSIGANVKEGIVAQSRKDFLSKMYIALKEASETEYWLDLLHETGYITQKCYDETIKQCNEINKILFATVKTTKRNEKVNIEEFEKQI